MAVSRAGRKGATKVFKHRRKSPWVPTLTGPFPNGQANAGSWLGTKNALYYCAQSAHSISWVLFVSSYMTAIDSITACLAHAPKKCTQSGNFQFDINYPVQNTASTRKLKMLFQKYKLELTTGIHVCIDHTFLNIQEIKMPRQLTATKTSHEKWIPIFSVSIMIIPTHITYFVKCKGTLLELNFYQPYPSSWRERKFCHCLFTSFTKREIRYFHVAVVQWKQRDVQKSVMHMQSCCFALSSHCFFYFLVAAAS